MTIRTRDVLDTWRWPSTTKQKKKKWRRKPAIPQAKLLSLVVLVSVTALNGFVSASSSSAPSSISSASPFVVDDDELTTTTPAETADPPVVAKSSIPRSVNNRRQQGNTASGLYSDPQLPPWNPSNQIDANGFLNYLYRRIPGEWERSPHHDDDDAAILGVPGYPSQKDCFVRVPVQIRQVPGDGNCLFHSISLCLRHAVNGTHWELNNSGNKGTSSSSSSLQELYQHSQWLRQQAVECLSTATTSSNRYPRSRLFLQGREWLRTGELVQAAASQYGLTPEEYCQSMQQDSVWGGGPEIVALCNLLQRPIHVYELAVVQAQELVEQDRECQEQVLLELDDTDDYSTDLSSSSYDDEFEDDEEDEGIATRAVSFGGGNPHKTVLYHTVVRNGPTFVLRRMACFGSPRFDRKQALHILSADSRFPDLLPGNQLEAGNHFLAVFPVPPRKLNKRRGRRRPRRLRGGADDSVRRQEAKTNRRFWGLGSSSSRSTARSGSRLEEDDGDSTRPSTAWRRDDQSCVGRRFASTWQRCWEVFWPQDEK